MQPDCPMQVTPPASMSSSCTSPQPGGARLAAGEGMIPIRLRDRLLNGVMTNVAAASDEFHMLDQQLKYQLRGWVFGKSNVSERTRRCRVCCTPASTGSFLVVYSGQAPTHLQPLDKRGQ